MVVEVEVPPQPDVSARAKPFALSDVRLLDGPFKEAMERDAAYLLEVESDRLPARFCRYAGLEPKSEEYGGWERDTLSGHSLGHYLSARSLLYGLTGDVRCKERVASVVEELAACQKAHGDGFVAGFAGGRKLFEELAAGDEKMARGVFDLRVIRDQRRKP